MRAVVQRVKEADVTVDNIVTGECKKGLMVLLGVEEGDTEKDLEYILDKVTGLRIFEDSEEKMNLSIKDIDGEMLIVSQFTLLGDVRHGKRPSFSSAAKPDIAKEMYEEFVRRVRNLGIKAGEGVFQADMLVRIYNDGPVTILLDSRKTF